MPRGRWLAGMVLAALLAAGSAPAADAPLGQSTVDPTRLRVCADPAYLPFSDERGEGFENKIAELLAAHLGRELSYTWYPQSMGFVRNTLRAQLCDLIMGVVAADELVQNTNPYYRSTYVLLHRAGEGDRFGSIDGPLARLARIGVVAGTPPADLLARAGLFANVRPYQLMVDTRTDQPARDMVADLAAGRIDIALLWGPIAGYWAKRQPVPLALVPLESDPRSRLRLDFLISMGIRHGDPEWKHTINAAIRALQPQIDEILDAYAVPRLDRQGRLVGVWAAARTEPAAVPEPIGYRLDNYRAPTPRTLRGAEVLDTAGLRRLLAEQRPVLVDVMPHPRKPPGRDADLLWIEPKRSDLPGSVWLPNTGLGELPPSTARWFAERLERLTGGDRDRPVVFYCDRDCWMSWNAARRAVVELGYRRVHWYPDGIQGWAEAGLELVPAVPEAEPPPGS
jgi:quinoprotein dehydrogenase-associated probable ABC transporter substrate-binding protein/PQQ-dependent catabolism-associated CXXCW motif protein